MYIRYIDEWLHPCIREISGISIRKSALELDNGTATEGAELYDLTLGDGYKADGRDIAQLAWFSSWSAAMFVLERLGKALAEGGKYFDLTAYDENGELKS